MTIVKSDEEYLAFYARYYNVKYCKALPKNYPCIVRAREAGGGLAGEYWEFQYFPSSESMGFAAANPIDKLQTVIQIRSAEWQVIETQ